MNIYKDYDIYGFIRLLMSVFLGTQWHKLHYLRLNTDINFINKQLEGFDLEVFPLEYSHMSKGDQNVFKGGKLALYEKRFKDENYFGYGIEENGKLIYSTWISVGNLGLPHVSKKIVLLPNEGLLEDSYCAPAARGRGLHGKMNFYRIKKLYEKGKDRVLAIVMDGNTPAMKVQLKSGFEELGVFYIGKIFWVPFCTLKKTKFDKL